MIKDFNKDAIITGGRRITYYQMLQYITLFANYTQKGNKGEELLPATSRRKVVIVSENREGFIYAFFSIWLNKSIAVPIDATSNVHEIAYVLNDCNPDAVWATISTEDNVRAAIKETGKDIKVLLIDDYEHSDIPEKTLKANIEFEQEQTAIIIYTSGTTGNPKGVMLSFKNLLTNIHSVTEEVHIITESRRALILLPLHHVLPLQGTMIAPLLVGAGVAISPSLAASDIMQTMKNGKVGLFIGVPRLWQMFYNGIMKKINASPFTKFLYKICDKADNLQLSRFIFSKVHKMMGGNLEICVSGGAALDTSIWKGLHVLGIDLVEGYGMTECAPIIAFNRPDEIICGCVGKPLPSCQVKIIDGEICAKGNNVMQGYYNRPEETDDIIDENGWLHSGDLGYMDEQEHVYVTGRKKEIIVLSNGKNINPTDIESHIEHFTQQVKEAAVIDENDQLKAIICPQQKWAEGKDEQQIENAIKKEVIDKINQELSSYKKIFGIYIYYGELPRTRLDKIQRFKLRRIIEECKNEKIQEENECIETPTSIEYSRLVTYINSEKNCKAKPSDNIITDLALDSLDIVGLQCFIEHTFGINLSQATILSFPNIYKLSEHIRKHKIRILDNDINWRDLLLNDSENFKSPKMWTSGWWIINLLKKSVQSYFNMKIDGIENIPKDGQFIMVANHQSFLDSLFLVQGMNKTQFCNTCFFAKEEHVKSRFIKYIAFHHGVILLEHNRVKDSILNLGRAIKTGANIMIFPEGTRTDDGNLNEFRPTFAILSKTFGIPVIPVRIEGAFEAMPKHQKIPLRKPITVTFLPPCLPNEYSDEVEMVEGIKLKIKNNKTN